MQRKIIKIVDRNIIIRKITDREFMRGKVKIVPIVAFPAILTIGILIIPVVSDYSNHLLAEQAVRQTARWFWGHLISAIAFGFGSLAAYSIHRYLSKRGQASIGRVSIILIAIGSTLFAFGLGADGIGPLASMAGGGSAFTFFEGSGMWVSGVFIAASIIFGLGLIIQVIGLIRAGMLKGLFRIVTFVAAIIFIASTAIPSGWGLYGVAAAAIVIYLTIGIVYWHIQPQEES
jgi:hypothetical protein